MISESINNIFYFYRNKMEKDMFYKKIQFFNHIYS